MIELDYSKIELSLTSTHKKVSLIVKKCEPFFEFTFLFYSAAFCQRLASMRDRLEIARLKLK